MTLLVSVIGLIFGIHAARDAFIGGGAATLGTAFFAVWVFGRYSAADPASLVRRFYMGELLKLATIVIVFAVAMKKIDDLNPLALLLAFLVVQVLPPMLANKIAR